MEEASDFVKGKSREQDDAVLAQAREILRKRVCAKPDLTVNSTKELAEYLCTRVGGLHHEAFGVVFLDLKGGLVAVEELFRGTLTQVAAFPREVAKAALAHNAAAVVVYHSHPSGDPTPSEPDRNATVALAAGLDILGITLVDHIVVSGDKWVSMAEKQMMQKKRVPRELRGMPRELAELVQELMGGSMVIDR